MSSARRSTATRVASSGVLVERSSTPLTLAGRLQPLCANVLRLARGGVIAAAAVARPDELVSDVAHRADHRFVLDAELGPQPSHVDVDRACAAEVVIAPHLLNEVRAGEHPA